MIMCGLRITKGHLIISFQYLSQIASNIETPLNPSTESRLPNPDCRIQIAGFIPKEDGVLV